MPRSRVRDGRKAHNKRIKLRKDQMKALWKKASEEAWRKFEEMKKEIQELKEQEPKEQTRDIKFKL